MRKVVIGSFLLLMLLSSGLSAAEPIYGELPNEKKPSLQIRKWISKNDLKLGENLTVTVNITNWSLQWAFNLSITEPTFSEFAAELITDFDRYEYTAIGPEGSIYYEYSIKPQTIGNYSVEPTRIEFFDENSTLFRAVSAFIPFFVFVEAPPIDLSEVWQNLFWMSFVLFAIPIIVYFINKYIWRKK